MTATIVKWQRPCSGKTRPLLAKTCIKCGALRMASDFPITGSCRLPDPRCKACHNRRNKSRYAEQQGRAWRKHVEWKWLIALSCRTCGQLTDRDALTFQHHECRSCAAASLRKRGPEFPSAKLTQRIRQEKNIQSGKWTVFAKGRHVIAKSCRLCGALVSEPFLRPTRSRHVVAYCARCTRDNWLQLQSTAGPRVKQKDAALPAPRRGYIWTGPELEQIDRRDLTVRQIAEMLGRSVEGVRRQRTLLNRGEPRQVYLAGVARQPVRTQ